MTNCCADAAAEKNEKVILHRDVSYERLTASVGVISHEWRLSGNPIPIKIVASLYQRRAGKTIRSAMVQRESFFEFKRAYQQIAASYTELAQMGRASPLDH